VNKSNLSKISWQITTNLVNCVSVIVFGISPLEKLAKRKIIVL